MQNTHAYCFDLDGTLIDSEVIWVEAVREYLAERLETFSHAEAQALVYGRSWQDIYQDIVRKHPQFTMPIASMEAAIAPHYQRMAAQRDIRIPTSIALLQRLAETHPVCIVSGSSRKTVGEAIEMMGIGACLRFYLGADDYAPGKPAPACYRLAADKLGLAPASCVVFEDSNAGARAAKAAGMQCVVLVRPGRPSQDFSMADLVLEDLGDYRPSAA
ncbi:MAG: HAD family phosphatase [Lentisphaerae bacterium]|nr:HAD family phosphatase [Lentisphaerota bacterium]